MICKDFKYPKLLEYFEKISSIPRMSYHEQEIANYLVDFAKERGLEYYTDSANNVLINLPASEGMEGSEPILLQGHTDMVCECNMGVAHDFLKEGLKLYVEDGELRAEGTTLGADDGSAVAVMLALLDGEIYPHPACQCLFTASEEVGLDGAKAFDYSKIFARRMINMDGADERALIVGCAGGLRSDSVFCVEYGVSSHSKLVKLSIGGLMGGHSGENINDGRANANKLAIGLLSRICDVLGGDVVSVNGGTKDNAIPREATVVVAVSDIDALGKLVSSYETEVKGTLCADDRDFFISYEECGDGKGAAVFSKEFTRKIIRFADSIDNGVLAMSKNIEGLVEYSRNLGIIETIGDKIGFYFSSRSAIDEQIEKSRQTIEVSAAECGGSTTHHGRYPGWNYTGYSKLAEAYIECAREKCSLDVEKIALHAGLECGIIKQAIPEMDIISCGPNIKDLHSPKESMNLASFERFFTIIKAIIEG